MRNFCSILFLLLAVSCLTVSAKEKQRMPIPEATDEWDILARKEFKKQRDAFLANDSVADALTNLGWADDLKTDMLFPKDKKHSFILPYGIIFHKAAFGSSIEYSPCGESVDTDEYWSEHAVSVHKVLDSALVVAKRKAVARLFMRAAHTIWSETEVNVADSTIYDDLYSNFMQQADFDCIAVNKDRKGNFIVYATLHVPRVSKKNDFSDEEMLHILFQMSDYVQQKRINDANENKIENTKKQ